MDDRRLRNILVLLIPILFLSFMGTHLTTHRASLTAIHNSNFSRCDHFIWLLCASDTDRVHRRKADKQASRE